MGCCQANGIESEVIFDKNGPDSISSFRPIHIIHIPTESDQKLEPTPSFGTGNKNFVFDSSSRDNQLLDIN